MTQPVLNVALAASEQVVYAEDFISASDQTVDQVTAQKACTAGDQNALMTYGLTHVNHLFLYCMKRPGW